jgi:hypothetical protein
MNGYFVGDGYDYDGYIAEVDNLHGDVKFRYRPTTSEENAEFSRQVTNNMKNATKLGVELIASKLISWSIPQSPVKELLAKLQPVLFGKLLNIILGQRPSDELPAGETPLENPNTDGEEAVKN